MKENALAACLQCHSIGQAGEAKKNGFSTRIHLTHGGPKLHMECTACHTYAVLQEFRPYWTNQFMGCPERQRHGRSQGEVQLLGKLQRYRPSACQGYG